MNRLKLALQIFGYSLLTMLIGFCYLVPSSEYRSAQGMPIYDADSVLVMQIIIGSLIVPIVLLLYWAIRQRKGRLRWLKRAYLIAGLLLLSWRWIELANYQSPSLEILH